MLVSPKALANTWRKYSDEYRLILFDNSYDVPINANALATVTEWQEFRSPDFQFIKDSLSSPVIFDGRNLYDPDVVVSDVTPESGPRVH